MTRTTSRSSVATAPSNEVVVATALFVRSLANVGMRLET